MHLAERLGVQLVKGLWSCRVAALPTLPLVVAGGIVAVRGGVTRSRLSVAC